MQPPNNTPRSLITIGRVLGAFGVRGWVHLASFTSPENNLFTLAPLYLSQGQTTRPIHLKAHQAHQKAWVAQFDECTDRDIALAWRGAYIQVSREQLPPLPDNQFYWVDLEGLEVINMKNETLGYVDHLFNTGANDLMAVKKDGKEIYIPFIPPDVVKNIDIENKVITVDWGNEDEI